MNFLKYRIAATNVQNTQNTQNQHNTNKTKCENDSEITQKTKWNKPLQNFINITTDHHLCGAYAVIFKLF